MELVKRVFKTAFFMHIRNNATLPTNNERDRAVDGKQGDKDSYRWEAHEFNNR